MSCPSCEEAQRIIRATATGYDALEKCNDRVVARNTDLLIANNRLIEQRRALAAALRTAAEQFRSYERHHAEKAETAAEDCFDAATPEQRDAAIQLNHDRATKAERNRWLAEICEAALAEASPS